MRTHTTIDSPIGSLTLTATDGTLTGISMAEHLRGPDPMTSGRRVGTGFEEVTEQLAGYFAGERTRFTLRTQPAGTDFQRRVWQAAGAIPYGETCTYARLADAVGRPDRLRAAAAALGRNPLAIVVPCHRVIGADGRLTGFSGGLARKRFLLDLEHSAALGQAPLTVEGAA